MLIKAAVSMELQSCVPALAYIFPTDLVRLNHVKNEPILLSNPVN